MPQSIRGDDFYLVAFSCLATERSFPGNGIGPIPWSKAWDYGAKHGLGRRMCNYFARVILVLDGYYREHLREEQEREDSREERRARRESKASGETSGLQKRRQHRARR
ncbi:MAG: hypothetical protein IIC73_02430 [Armatimonadetes bacterium]|nr:hypothetical protein [Armatimonadota bacterium]